MAQGITIVSEAFSGPFQTPEFQESIRKCFVSVGLAPCTEAGSY
jgi:hypothetical protein